ncbi:MAG: hypothetical protein CL472_02240 [Acidobacteria bacterium]|nr:hypothetical protein [Acidobacteriota bacterium]
MRPSAYTDTSLMRHTDEDERPGEVWGVLLAGDYTAEHEGGIGSILSRLGIDEKGIMVSGRSMADGGRQIDVISGTKTEAYHVKAPTEKNPNRHVKKKVVSKVKGLTTNTHVDTISRIVHEAPRYGFDKEVTGAWSNRDFAIVGWSDEAKQFVSDLSEALASGNVTVWIGGAAGNPFARNGLIIAITSRLPQKGVAHMNEADDNSRRLDEAAEKTGIKSLIKKAAEKGKIATKSFYKDPWRVLKPNWADKADSTKHPVKFYLAPADNDQYQNGWYTVEELTEWTRGKGPVIKPAE